MRSVPGPRVCTNSPTFEHCKETQRFLKVGGDHVGSYDGAQGPHLPELTPLFFYSRIEWSGYLHSTLFKIPIQFYTVLCLIIARIIHILCICPLW